jgi:hypothetical protein
MWKCEHEYWCNDQSRFDIVRGQCCVEDKDGNILVTVPGRGEVVFANCSKCYAPAEWEEGRRKWTT